MAKIISISDEAYNELVKIKKGSFSKTILSLLKDRKSSGVALLELAGSLKGEEKDWQGIVKNIYKNRKESKERKLERWCA